MPSNTVWPAVCPYVLVSQTKAKFCECQHVHYVASRLSVRTGITDDSQVLCECQHVHYVASRLSVRTSVTDDSQVLWECQHVPRARTKHSTN